MCIYVFLKTVNELEDPKSMLEMTKVNSAKESTTVVREKTEYWYSGGGGVERESKKWFFFNCRRQKCKYIDHDHQEICLTWKNHFVRLLEGILFTEILRLSTHTSIIPKNF